MLIKATARIHCDVDIFPKIQCIKEVRAATNWGLKQAKDFVEMAYVRNTECLLKPETFGMIMAHLSVHDSTYISSNMTFYAIEIVNPDNNLVFVEV